MPTQTDLAYIAGIVDGEAYIGVKKQRPSNGRRNPGYHARIQIRMVHEPAIAFVAETLGGHYYREKPHANNGRPLYCFQASDKIAGEMLARLLPYLRVKREAAENVLALRTLQADHVAHKTKKVGEKNFPNAYGARRMVPVFAFSDEYLAQLEAFYLRAKELNTVGI